MRTKKWATQLANLGYKDYKTYLKGEHWKKFKQWTKKQGFYDSCYVCGDKNSINLHHFKYVHVDKDQALCILPLCHIHHQEIHDHKGRGFNIRQATVKVTGGITRELKKKLRLLNSSWMETKKNRIPAKVVKDIKKVIQPQIIYKDDKRQFSLKIVKGSGMPETLHHSIQMIINKRYTLLEWVAKKEKIGDYKMLGLYHLYEEQVIKYLQNN